MEVSYYTTEDDAINEVSSISGEYKSGGKKKIWVRLSNSRSGCYDISSFYFVVSGSPLTLDLIDFSSCRDDNGIAFFDFTRNSNLIKISEPNTNITYHLSREDAEVFTGIIPEIYYSSISSTIWCRINSEDNNECYSLSFFEIRVFDSPNSVSISDIHSCDYEGLGKAEFNFADQRQSIFDQEELDVKVSFHLSLEDADSSKNSLYDVYEATNSDVYTRIESIYNKSCYIIQEFKIVVEEFEINKKIADMNLCNENNEEGELFTLPNHLSKITTDPNLRASFYASKTEAENDTGSVNHIYVKKNEDQTVYLRLENKRTGCVYKDLSFLVKYVDIPQFEIDSLITRCTNDPNYSVSVHSYKDEYEYLWEYELYPSSYEELESTSEISIISKIGKYRVTAISKETNCEYSREFEVIASDIPEVTFEDIIIDDNDKTYNITISDTIKNCEFSLDDINGPYQDEHYFEDVFVGEHVLYVRSKDNCGISIVEFPVIMYPKYMSVNNDGVVDQWEISGLNIKNYKKVSVKIYDRTGRLLKTLTGENLTWDGKLNGVYMPKNDYWFTVEMIGLNDKSMSIVGHFSLLR